MEFKLVTVRHRARSKPCPSDGCGRSYRNRAVMVPSYFRLRQATTPRPLPAPAQLGYIGPGHEPSFHQKKKALGGRAAVRCRGSTFTFGFERLTVQLLDNVFLFTTKCLELQSAARPLGAGHHPRQARAARFSELTSHSCQRAA